MSTSNDAGMTDLGTVLAAVANPPSLATSATSVTDPFVLVGRTMASFTAPQVEGGTEGEYDGGAKCAHLFLFDIKSQAANPLCLGFVGVGQDNKRFCLKPATTQDPSGRSFCGVQRHLQPFQAVDGVFYPRANKIVAYCFRSQ
jgi:hypothetical protein